MKYQVYNRQGEKVEEVELNQAVFDIEVNEELVHQAVVAQMANKRKVLARTKDKSEVRGGGRKPWKQKGTGRARHGSSRSPLWIGGGVTFGPTKDRNFKKKINKKMKRKALFMCLSDRVKDKNLLLLDKLELNEAKTKELYKLLRVLISGLLNRKDSKINYSAEPIKLAEGEERKKTEEKKKIKKDEKLSILVVGSKNIAKLARAGRNIAGIKVLDACSLNVIDVLTYKYILMGLESLTFIEKTYLNKK